MYNSCFEINSEQNAIKEKIIEYSRIRQMSSTNYRHDQLIDKGSYILVYVTEKSFILIKFIDFRILTPLFCLFSRVLVFLHVDVNSKSK